jgi:hypothetical protein
VFADIPDDTDLFDRTTRCTKRLAHCSAGIWAVLVSAQSTSHGYAELVVVLLVPLGHCCLVAVFSGSARLMGALSFLLCWCLWVILLLRFVGQRRADALSFFLWH